MAPRAAMTTIAQTKRAKPVLKKPSAADDTASSEPEGGDDPRSAGHMSLVKWANDAQAGKQKQKSPRTHPNGQPTNYAALIKPKEDPDTH